MIASAGCISSRTVTTVPGSGGHTWSGTGRISRDHRGMVAALEGQKLPLSPDFRTGPDMARDVAQPLYSEPYTLGRVKGATAATMQAVIRDERHVHFGGECLPIATTGRDPFRNHYLAVASPATGRILLYRAGALHEGPVAVRTGQPSPREGAASRRLHGPSPERSYSWRMT